MVCQLRKTPQGVFEADWRLGEERADRSGRIPEAFRALESEAYSPDRLPRERLQALVRVARRLAETLLPQNAERILADGQSREILVDASGDALELPLESLLDPGGFPLLLGGRALVRCPRGVVEEDRKPLGEKLRVLVMAASPESENPLDYEREEERILTALEPLRAGGASSSCGWSRAARRKS